MINPQMMGMGQIPNVPPVTELWKNEKSKYRHWIILFGVGLIAIFGIMLASFIMNLIGAGSFKVAIVNNIFKVDDDGSGVKYELAKSMAKRIPGPSVASMGINGFTAMVNSLFTKDYIIFPAIQLALILIGLVLYADSLMKAYKAKSFAKLSTWPTMIVGISAIIAFFAFMPFGSNTSFSDQFQFPGGIFKFVANILFIVIYFAASAPVSRLRRTFLLSERIAQMKAMQNSPQFKQAQQQFMQGQGAMGAFGPMAGQQAQPGQAGTQQAGDSVTPAQPEVDPELKKLQAMDKAELIAIAKELSISGYSTMNKKELIDAILRVTKD